MYLTPDLTGENTLYKIDNDIRLIFMDNQVIEFPEAIYADTLTITMLGTTNKILVKGADWNYSSSDIAVERTSEMKLVDSSFSRPLIKRLTIIKSYVGADYRINCTYQRLYPEFAKVALYDNGEPLEFTPDVFAYMLTTLRKHDNLLSPISNVYTITNTNPLLLEVDPKCELSENIIVDEKHTLDVPNNISVIHPIAGSFFWDTLSVTSVELNRALVLNVDYVIFGCDFDKTRITTNPSGVYKFILFLNDFVGSVKISYHAYGGDPTITDVRSLEETTTNLIQYITEAQLLTPSTVSTAPVITVLKNKIEELEDTMRKLATSGRPSYGDLSTGGCLTKKIMANDTNFHWWTVASLYKVDGSNTIFTADTMKLRVQTLYTKFAFDVVVNVNILNPSKILDVKVISATYPKGYIDFTDYTELQNIIRPQIRIIWNENTVSDSGIYLQLGMRLKTVAEETVAVEDWSGAESAWKLISSPNTSVLPEDNTLTLPNNNHVWDTLNSDSKSKSFLLPFPDGHIIWAGESALNRPVAGWINLSLTHLLENEVDITNIKRLRLDLEEDGADVFPVMIDFIPGSKRLVGTSAFSYNGKEAYINAVICRNVVTDKIEFSVNANIVAGLAANQLNIKQALIFL